ncbi:MAG: glycosyltransferase family 2 protein [Anaerolineae bacterium]|nr:glycosyltransferase family 2 protein [Gloeobacterales cyanobacterium ES-bin-313]
MQNLTVIILTFNSEDSLVQVVKSCKAFASRIIVVDSLSTDTTPMLAANLGCEVVQHPFENYSIQRNWAQTYACLGEQDWVLHLDSDEVVSEELTQSICQLESNPAIDGYLMRRLSYFLGKPIRFGQINPSWHLRLFRASKGFCEERLYDQHFVTSGKIRKMQGLLLDLQITTLEKWTAAHNRWSTAEALEVCSRSSTSERQLTASLFGDLRMQKRWLKNNFWYRSPLLLRAFVFFFYSYFLRLGFLDGKAGLIYHVLQSFWFRYLVDAKIVELQIQQQAYSDNKSKI